MASDKTETIRRLADVRDVVKAIAAAARLLDDQLEAHRSRSARPDPARVRERAMSGNSAAVR
jgi:hypothetical protein